MRVLSTAILVLVVACVLLAVCRWIGRRDPLAGLIVQVGLALRLWAGATLFWISYLNLPIFQQLQSGQGFWLLAPDARNYFEIAARAADAGVNTISGLSPSPAFTRTLGLWMRIVGVSPASGLLLNVLAYVGVAALIVGIGARYQTAGSQRVRLIPLAAFSLSPALVLFGTQTLKDQFFCLALAVACAGAWLLFRVFSSGGSIHNRPSGAAGLLMLAGALYLVSGIRPYVGLLVIAVLVLVLLAITVREVRFQFWLRNTLLLIGVLMVLWIPFRLGAGAYYDYYQIRLSNALGIASGPTLNHLPVLDELANARQRFVESGGATNIQTAEFGDDAGWFARGWLVIRQVFTGLALLVVPVSILQGMSLVQLQGGRGLLLFTDIDTVFLDLTIGAVGCAVVKARRSRSINWPCTLFVGLLCAALALMMAYVVTNFGTLFRLRLMAATLLWLLPIAMVQPTRAFLGGEESADDSRTAAGHLLQRSGIRSDR